jgi:hypothetical protein
MNRYEDAEIVIESDALITQEIIDAIKQAIADGIALARERMR